MKAKDTPFSANYTLRLRGKLLDLSEPKVMGILNVTPDSFYAGSRIQDEKALLLQAESMLDEGADLLDIGGYSSRPGAAEVPPDEEMRRVLWAVSALRKAFPDVPLSIDSFRSAVAEKAVEAGADLINDISGGALDEQMFATVARLQVPYILMHMRGNPQTMTRLNQYDELLKEIIDYFAARLNQLRLLGVKDIVADPGFGFAKNIQQNFMLLHKLPLLKLLDVPILAGVSRKSFIWKSLGLQPDQAGNGSTVLHTLALEAGASILRVHDVRLARETIKLWQLTKAKRD